MREGEPTEWKPEHNTMDEYQDDRDRIRDEAIYLTRDVIELGTLAQEAGQKIGEGARPLSALEMDAFRSAYHDYPEEINAILKRLDWNMPPPDMLRNPGVPSEGLIRRATMLEFDPDFGIHHEVTMLSVNEDVTYKHGKEGYGVEVEFGRDGSFYTHSATQDEITALRDLIAILAPRYKAQYEKLINEGTE